MKMLGFSWRVVSAHACHDDSSGEAMEQVGHTIRIGLVPESFPSTTAGTAGRNATDSVVFLEFSKKWPRFLLSPTERGINNSTLGDSREIQREFGEGQTMVRLTVSQARCVLPLVGVHSRVRPSGE